MQMFHPFLVCAKIIVLRLTPQTNKKKRLAFEPLSYFIFSVLILIIQLIRKKKRNGNCRSSVLNGPHLYCGFLVWQAKGVTLRLHSTHSDTHLYADDGGCLTTRPSGETDHIHSHPWTDEPPSGTQSGLSVFPKDALTLEESNPTLLGQNDGFALTCRASATPMVGLVLLKIPT